MIGAVGVPVDLDFRARPCRSAGYHGGRRGDGEPTRNVLRPLVQKENDAAGCGSRELDGSQPRGPYFCPPKQAPHDALHIMG